jgi:two-component system, OmpR family, response regulator
VVADTNLPRRVSGEHDGRNKASRDRAGLRILVVDDDPGIAETTALLLRLHGHEVSTAFDGPSALQAAAMVQPDVMMLDVVLPGMDGWEVAERIREQAREKRPFLVALTGCGAEVDRQRSKEAGIHLHLEKPVDPNYLCSLLARLQDILLRADE